MPSPIGHALAGIAAGMAVATRPASVRRAVLFGAVAMAPDLDLLIGAHSGPSHGVGAAVLVGLVAAAVRLPLRVALAMAAAYGSHIVLDWLGSDTSPPIGIMALWPFSREYYESSLHVFMAISRRYWLPEFWTHNLIAIARELAVLGPLVAVVVWWRRRA